ncbi:MAG: site-specific integrase [Desulfocapsaceae bacterium]|nr:site-specific integrase [Desulfocapsaceae bacterium]
MLQWIKANSPGVRFRVHSTRKHGIKYDQYFSIRYRIDGKVREEGLGWATEGWTEKKAVAELAELKKNHTTGRGHRTLAEGREIRAQVEQEKAVQEKEEKIKNLSYADIFSKYLIYSQNNKRSAKSWKREEQLTRLHIIPVFKSLPLGKIAQIHLERLKKNMADAGLSPRTVRYALAVVRQVFNYAIREGVFTGQNPAAGGKVVRPQEDNKKDRYLSRVEAELLLLKLGKRSGEVHDMAMLSLYTGMRFGEVASLKWADIDTFQGIIMLRNTKSGKNRPAYMTPDIKKMFARRGPGGPDQLVFPARGKENKPHSMISHIYYDVVGKLFNQGVVDKKRWVNFHSLRHTFASWLVEANTNLYLIKDLLGHSDLKLTERYAHIGENQLKQAVMKLQNR